MKNIRATLKGIRVALFVYINGGSIKVSTFYTIDSLDALPHAADIRQLSLKLLLEYYEQKLSPYIYQYEVPGKPTIELTFPKAQFCHLLAIEKIMTANKQMRRNSKNYRGILGYENIKNNIITFEIFRNKPYRGTFFRNKNKFTYFHLLPKVIENPILIDFDSSKVDPSTKISADLVFYNVVSGDYLHLAVVKTEEAGNRYRPRSWFIQSKSDPHIDKFIVDQQKITISKISKEIITS
jgi:hypothetical protein